MKDTLEHVARAIHSAADGKINSTAAKKGARDVIQVLIDEFADPVIKAALTAVLEGDSIK